MNNYSNIKNKAPADLMETAHTETTLGVMLPEDLLEFYKESNGGEGTVGEKGYIQLWGLNQLIKLNQALEVQKYMPGSFLFASNGGSFNYGYDSRSDKKRYFMVDPIGMPEELFEGGTTLEQLLDKIGAGSLDRINY